MFRAIRLHVATLALLVLLAPSIAGCTGTQHVPFNEIVGLDRITGVTTRSGLEIPFVTPGAQITNDTLYAVGRHGQVILSTDSIARVWNRKFSAVRTAGLAGGLVAGAYLALLIAVASSGPLFSIH